VLRLFRFVLSLIFLAGLVSVGKAQSLPASQQAAQSPSAAPVRDPQAVAALRQAFAAMGGRLPADTVATGTITIVEGSRTETGTIRDNLSFPIYPSTIAIIHSHPYGSSGDPSQPDKKASNRAYGWVPNYVISPYGISVTSPTGTGSQQLITGSGLQDYLKGKSPLCK
jgi:hypothetical protein